MKCVIFYALKFHERIRKIIYTAIIHTRMIAYNEFIIINILLQNKIGGPHGTSYVQIYTYMLCNIYITYYLLVYMTCTTYIICTAYIIY